MLWSLVCEWHGMLHCILGLLLIISVLGTLVGECMHDCVLSPPMTPVLDASAGECVCKCFQLVHDTYFWPFSG